MQERYLEITLPDGRIVTRRSKPGIRFAVAVRWEKFKGEGKTWGTYRWCRSKEEAILKANEAQDRFGLRYDDTVIVPVRAPLVYKARIGYGYYSEG